MSPPQRNKRPVVVAEAEALPSQAWVGGQREVKDEWERQLQGDRTLQPGVPRRQTVSSWGPGKSWRPPCQKDREDLGNTEGSRKVGDGRRRAQMLPSRM